MLFYRTVSHFPTCHTIFSDMSHNLTGIHDIDHERSVGLVRSAFKFALEYLDDNGNFIAKLFQGNQSPSIKDQ